VRETVEDGLPDKKLLKTGETGGDRDENGRFLKGQSGNPAGRPPGRSTGRFRAGSRAAALLLDGAMEELMGIAIEASREGDRVTLRNCLNKGIGTRRGQPLVLDDVGEFPAVTGPGDVAAATATIGRWIGEGRVTPEEGLHLAQALGLPAVDTVRAEPPAETAIADVERMREEIKHRLDRIAQAMQEGGEAAAAWAEAEAEAPEGD
jgi:hypothetical protein